MTVIQERVVASGRGIRAERDLAEAASDFYVLELLTARGDPDAARLLAGLDRHSDARGTTMASLFVWKGNEATVCRFHRTPSDWEYEPLSPTETLEFVQMLQAGGLAKVSPCEPCEMGYGGRRPGGPLSFAEAVLTA